MNVFLYRVNKEEEITLQNSNDTMNGTMRNNIMYIYTALTLGNILISTTKTVYFMLFFIVASRNLHNFIFSRIIRATMTFYNNNPSGRILNRFSKDLGVIDEYLPSVIIDVIEVSSLIISHYCLSRITKLQFTLVGSCVNFTSLISYLFLLSS